MSSNVYTKTTMFSKGLVGTAVMPDRLVNWEWPQDSYEEKENFKRDFALLLERYPTLDLGRIKKIILEDHSYIDDDFVPIADPDQAEVVDET